MHQTIQSSSDFIPSMIASKTPQPRQTRNLLARSRSVPETVSVPQRRRKAELSFREAPSPKVETRLVLSRYRDIIVPIDPKENAPHGDQAWLGKEKQIFNSRYGTPDQRGWIPERTYQELKRRSGDAPKYKYEPHRPRW